MEDFDKASRFTIGMLINVYFTSVIYIRPLPNIVYTKSASHLPRFSSNVFSSKFGFIATGTRIVGLVYFVYKLKYFMEVYITFGLNFSWLFYRK